VQEPPPARRLADGRARAGAHTLVERSAGRAGVRARGLGAECSAIARQLGRPRSTVAEALRRGRAL